jgi:hypothetical protein
MRGLGRIGAAAVVLLGAAGVAAADDGQGRDSGGGDRQGELLEVSHMIGVQPSNVGAAGTIRDVPAGGLPWVISEGKAELRGDGMLEVEVVGLVFDPNDPRTIAAGVAGKNTIPKFKAIVSCLTTQSGGGLTTADVATQPVDATQGLAQDGGGDARIEEQLQLPSPCIAPLVLVGPAANAWFATAGR